MTVSNADGIVTTTGNGITTTWPFSFNIPAADAVNVVTTVIATGAQSIIAAADYTVTGLNDPNGGDIVYPTVASGAPALTSATKITIYRSVVQTQLVTVANQTRYDAGVTESVWDRLTMMVQDLSERYSRSLHIQRGDTYSGGEPHIPIKADRLGKVLGFNATTGDMESYASAASDVTAAALSATAALASENAAAADLVLTNADVALTNTDVISTNVNVVSAAASAAAAVAAAAGIRRKDNCINATTANITLSGEQIIDGILTAGTRTLVKDQTAPAENGIYVSAAGAWVRSTDMDTWDEFPNATVAVEQGTVNVDKNFQVTSNSGGTLGTTAVTWAQVGGGDLVSSNNLSDISSAATSRTNLGLAIGTDVQAYDADLTTVATNGVGTGNNQIVQLDATAKLPAVDGSQLTNLPGGGKILQVVTVDVTAATFSSAATTWTDVTGLTLNITTASAASQVLVLCDSHWGASVANYLQSFRMMRGATPIMVGATAGVRAAGSDSFGSPSVNVTKGMHVSGVDTPGTAATHTYKLQCLVESGLTGYLNRSSNDADQVNRSRIASRITLMEIGA